MSDSNLPLIKRACDVCRTYAEMSEVGGAYKHLLLICGEPEALGKYTQRMNGPLLDGFEEYSLFDHDDDVHRLFDVMQKPAEKDGKRKHRDGAMSFDDKGKVVDASLWVTYENPNVDIAAICDEIRNIKGEVGTGHIAMLLGSMNPGVIVGIGMSEDANTVTPFVDGEIHRPGLYIPERCLTGN